MDVNGPFPSKGQTLDSNQSGHTYIYTQIIYMQLTWNFAADDVWDRALFMGG